MSHLFISFILSLLCLSCPQALQRNIIDLYYLPAYPPHRPYGSALLAAQTFNKNLVMLVHMVYGPCFRKNSSDLLAVLEKLDPYSLDYARMRLLLLNASLGNDYSLGLVRPYQRIELRSYA